MKRGEEIGKSERSREYIKVTCPDCDQYRWIQRRTKERSTYTSLCRSCSYKLPKIRACREKNPAWKGGRTISQDGYVYILAPHHPKANNRRYVFEHILIWEQTHNKPLPSGWVIHHLNGIKDDNRPRNLLALPRSGHHNQLVAQALKQRIRELETEVKLLEKSLEAQQLIFRIEEN